jgi:hypothetical protein
MIVFVCLEGQSEKKHWDGRFKATSLPPGEKYVRQFHLFDLFQYYNPIDQRTKSHFVLRRSKDNREIRKISSAQGVSKRALQL